MKSNGLTILQEKFCLQYVSTGNGKQSAIAAGYSSKTAESTASRLLTYVNVQKRIADLQAKTANKSEVTMGRLVNELSNIAFSSISHLHNSWTELKVFEALTDQQKACIQSISTKKVKIKSDILGEYEIVEFVKIQLYDKLKASDILSRMHGYYAPVKNEITGKDGRDLVPAVDYSRLSTDELQTFHDLKVKLLAKE